MNGANHWYWHLPPDIGCILFAIGRTIFARQKRMRTASRLSRCVRRAHGGKITHVEAGAKGPPLTRQDHGAQAGFDLQPFTGSNDRIEHGVIKRVHFIGAIEPYIRNAA